MHESKPDRKYLTIVDVCASLKVARSTYYDWRVAGKSPRCIKLPNGEVRIRQSDLDRWLENLSD